MSWNIVYAQIGAYQAPVGLSPGANAINIAGVAPTVAVSAQATGIPANAFSFSPTSGSPGTVITFTATSLPGNFTGCTAALTGIGSINDGALQVLNDTTALYTVPVDLYSGQFYLGNSFGTAFAGAPYVFTFVANAISPAPTGVAAVAQPPGTTVQVTWNRAVQATSYNVLRSTSSGSGYAVIGTSSTLAYVDSSVVSGTTYYYEIQGVNNIGTSASSAFASATPVVPTPGTVAVAVTSGTTQAISPYIYGVNGASYAFPAGTSSALPGVTFDRLGGNRLTAYNWTTNASNAGSDYQYENDAAMNTTPNFPASATTDFITFDQGIGVASLMTAQLQGYVAADEAGPCTNPGPQAGRFDAVQYAKGAGFVTGSSIPLTGTVYMDEFVYNVDHLLAGQGVFTNSPTTHPVFVSLDNEPDLWNYSHSEIQGNTNITPAAFITNTIALAKAIKNQFPNVKIFGPVNWGWSGVQSWQNAISYSITGNNWFIDQYAQALATASAAYGKPLVDVYDFHWYSQIVDADPTSPGFGHVITGFNTTPLTDSQMQLIMQSTRSLYDPTFVENSWIPGTIGGAGINALPRFNAKLAAANPGMKLSITEYFTGGGATIAGTVAQADFLGALGANGVFAASIWQLSNTDPAIVGGFTAFRNFDGAGSSFGDTSVLAVSNNIANVSAYVSTDSKNPGRVVMVLINRSPGQQNVTVSGIALSGTAYIYQMTAANIPTGNTPMAPTLVGSQAASGTSITLALPYYSVTTVNIIGVVIPAVPTGLSAISGNAQVALTWNASAGATSYHVKRSTTSLSGYTQIAAPTSASYLDTSLTNGTIYYYVVSAVDSAGESANCAQVSATPSIYPVGEWISVTPSVFSTPSNMQTAGVAVDPLSGDVYASAGNNTNGGGTSTGVYKSTDSGATWVQVSTGTNAASINSGLLWDMAFDSAGSALYVANGYGSPPALFKSTRSRSGLDEPFCG